MPDMPLWQKIAWLAIAGVLGTLCRFGLATLVQRLHPFDFPWGTFAVNAIGCLLFGIVWALAEERGLINLHVRAILLVGFLGAFTTFSSFAFETAELLTHARLLKAGAYVLLQNVSGVVLVLAGMAIGRCF
jgi:fluoride exporter